MLAPPPLKTGVFGNQLPINAPWEIWYSDLRNQFNAVQALGHNAATVADSPTVDLTIDANQKISAAVIAGGVDHAALANLNSANYYHLSQSQAIDLTDGGETTLHTHASGAFTHNSLGGLQGGLANEYYHLSAAQVAALHPAVTLANPNHGLSLIGQVLALGTPSTCTNLTANAVSGSSHTHEITGFALAGAAPAAHQLDGALHTVSGLTTGHFLKALSATTFGFAAHGLTYSDVGAMAVPSGTLNYLAKFTGSGTTIGNSPMLTDIANTMVGIGDVPSAAKIHVTDSSISILADNTNTLYYAGIGASYSANTRFVSMFQFGPTAAGTLFGVNKAGAAMIYSYGANRLVLGTYDNVPLYFGTNSTYAMSIATDQTIATASTLSTGGDINLGTAITSPALVLSGTGSNAGTIRAAAHTKYWYFFSGTDGNSPYAGFVGKDYVGALTPGIFYALSSAGSTFKIYGDNATTVYFQVTAGGNLTIPVDSKKLIFGAGDDSSIMDNGTNMVFTRETAGDFHFTGTGGNVLIGSGSTFDAGLRLERYYSRDGTDNTGFTVAGTYNDQTAHPIRVESIHPLASGKAIAAFDARATITGSNPVNHIVAFQSSQEYGSSGLIDDLYDGFFASGGSGGGTATRRHGLYIADYAGTMTVTTQYGLNIGNLTKAGTNWSIYTGSAPSRFGGNLAINTTTTTYGINIDGSISFLGSNSIPAAGIGLNSNLLYVCGGSAGLKLTDDNLNGILINDGGNVSIGNTNDTYRFDVSGTGRFTDDLSLVYGKKLILDADKSSQCYFTTVGYGGPQFLLDLVGPIVRINGTARLASVSNAVGDFLTLGASYGNVQKRTAAETLGDIGGVAKSYAVIDGKINLGITDLTLAGSSANLDMDTETHSCFRITSCANPYALTLTNGTDGDYCEVNNEVNATVTINYQDSYVKLYQYDIATFRKYNGAWRFISLSAGNG